MSARYPIIIHRLPSKRKESKDYQANREKLAKRRRKIGSMYDQLEKFLLSLPMCHTRQPLLKFAEELSKNIKKPIDRCAKRQLEALICWFCENWASIEPKILEVHQKWLKMDKKSYKIYKQSMINQNTQIIVPKKEELIDVGSLFDMAYQEIFPFDYFN